MLRSIKGSVARTNLLNGVVAVLKNVKAEALAPATVEWMLAKRIGARRKRRHFPPREPYTVNVVRAVVKACRAEVASTFAKYPSGIPRLPEQWQDPREDRSGESGAGWYNRDCLRWEIWHKGPLTLGAWAQQSGLTRVPAGLGQLGHELLPTYADIYPHYLLIIIGTGMTPAEAQEITVDSLRNPRSGRADLVVRKDRKGAEISRVVADTGAFSVGGLVRSLETLTRHVRHLAPGGLAMNRHLFMCLTTRGTGIMRDPFHEDEYARWSRALIEKHKLTDDDGTPLTSLRPTRFRKSFKEAEYRAAGGQLETMSSEHSPDVAYRHYVNIESLRPLHDASVLRGLEDARDSALAVRVLLASDEEALLAGKIQKVAVKLALSEEKTRMLAGHGTEAFLNKCSDPLDSPVTPKGQICEVADWACPDCPNVVWTEYQLPRVLHYMRGLEAQYEVMDPEEWNVLHGDRYHFMRTVVLAHFAPDVIENADRRRRDEEGGYHLHRALRVIS
jgi:hypothetical protein